MPAQNAYRVTEWNGAVGDRWVAHQARLDAMLTVFGDAALRAADPKPGDCVLDVGCGAGASTLALAERVGDAGYVLGLDISEALVRQAQALVRPGIDFSVADAADAPLPDAAFDLIFSRFGVMFFPDPVTAFANLRRALKPEGHLAFVCWREAAANDWVRLPIGAIKGIVPPSEPPAPDAPGPFSFGDPERVTRILSEAGFTQVTLAPFDHAIPFGQGDTREAAINDAVHLAFEVGPLSRALADQPDTVRERASEAVRRAFAEQPGLRSVMIEGAAWIVTANNSGGS